MVLREERFRLFGLKGQKSLGQEIRDLTQGWEKGRR